MQLKKIEGELKSKSEEAEQLAQLAAERDKQLAEAKSQSESLGTLVG